MPAFRRRSRAASLLAAFVAVFCSAAFASSAGADVFVDKSGADGPACGTQLAPCLTISGAQGGISHALVPHETVQVGAGTFTEQVIVDKDVVLKGSGLSSTVIASPAAPATQFQRNGA